MILEKIFERFICDECKAFLAKQSHQQLTTSNYHFND